MNPSLLLLWISHLLVDFCVGIWPLYKTVMGIDIVQASLIAGVSGFIGEAMQMFFGYFCDRGYRKVILILGVFLTSTIFFLPAVETLLGCFFCILFLMLGSGAFHPAAIGFASTISAERKGKGILFFASGGALGLGASQLIFSQIHQASLGLLLLPTVIVMFLLSKHRFPTINPSRAGQNIKDFLKPFKKHKKALIRLYFSQIANQGVFLSFVFLLPDLMREQNCHSWLCHGGGHLCMILGGGLTMVPAGNLADRYGHRPVMLVIICASILTLYTLLFVPTQSIGATMMLLVLFGGSLGLINPMIVSWGNTLVPESPSFVSALLMGMAWCFGHLGTIAIGLLAGSFALKAYGSAISVMGFLLIINFFLVLSIPSISKKIEKKTVLTD